MKSRWPAVLTWTLAAIWAIWATVRLFGLETGFPAVPLIAYTPYMALATFIPVTVALLLRRWIPAIVVGVAGLYLGLAILPRTLSDGEASEPLGGPTLKIVSANIFRSEADLGDLVEMVRERDADVLSVQELTPEGARALRQVGLEEVLPEVVLATRDGAYGGGLYSRFPLRRLQPALGTRFRMPRASVAVPGYGRVRLVGAHPYPPINSGSVRAWRTGLESLPLASSEGPPWVLAGDFNATLDHAELREVLDSGYRDAADVQGAGLQMTWSAGRLFPPPVAIDHVLADGSFSVLDFAAEDLPDSDHRAIYAKLSLPPG